MPWGDGTGPWWARGRGERWGWHGRGGWHHGGWGWRHGPWWLEYGAHPGYGYEYYDEPRYYSRTEEREFLRNRAELLRRELERIEERLKDLE